MAERVGWIENCDLKTGLTEIIPYILGSLNWSRARPKQELGTAEEYVQQAQTIAERVPETDPSKVKWLPLGVLFKCHSGPSAGR